MISANDARDMILLRIFSLTPFLRSLSARLLVLMIVLAMLAEVLISASSIVNTPVNWLTGQADPGRLGILRQEARQVVFSGTYGQNHKGRIDNMMSSTQMMDGVALGMLRDEL